MREVIISTLYSTMAWKVLPILKELYLMTREEFFLKEKSHFKNFKVDHCTVIWFYELDLAPEYLFYLVFKKDRDFQEQFKQWGFS